MILINAFRFCMLNAAAKLRDIRYILPKLSCYILFKNIFLKPYKIICFNKTTYGALFLTSLERRAKGFS